MNKDQPFFLDSRLENDTLPLAALPLCDLRLMNDSRWPWLILVPRIAKAEEIHHLKAEEQAMLYNEISKVAHALETVTGCLKINIGALGNIVRQLHVHIIARHENDANWPGPVWGFGKRLDYDKKVAETLVEEIKRQLE